MADKKISQLPLTAAVNADDTIEKSDHNAAPSQRFTPAQMATFMQTAMALVKLSGLNIQLNADGSAQFAGVKILFNADGSATFSNANVSLAADGAIDLPLIHLLADGSAQFANGLLNIGSDGSLNQPDATSKFSINASGKLAYQDGDIWSISPFGDASFAAGNFAIDSSGNLNSSGTLNLIGTTLTVNSIQVITAQQAAIPDSSVNLADVVAKFNTLLAALRTHGLIAT